MFIFDTQHFDVEQSLPTNVTLPEHRAERIRSRNTVRHYLRLGSH